MPNATRSQLIQHGEIAADRWQIVAASDSALAETDISVSPAPTGEVATNRALPMALWLAQRTTLIERKQRTGGLLGVWLAPTDDPAALAKDVAHLDLIAVRFPKFVDGRGYSTAALLRQRFGYRGELRAFGDVGRDQLFYLSRVGFDSFVISEGRDAEAALASLGDFPQVYQSAWNQPIPLFRRREASLAT